MRYYSYLSEVSRASICIDLPGNGPLCFRLIDYLAVGSCIVALPHSARLHVDLKNMEHVIYVDPNVEQIVEVCDALLARPRQVSDLVSASRDFFDRYLHAEQLAAYYLNKVIEFLG